MKKNSLIFLELNEINFDVIQHYIDSGVQLNGFEKLLRCSSIHTTAENEYELLEPWIQWPSVHTGKTFEEHQIFRLGDFINSSEDQIFEQVENLGLNVGAISPMNASNKLKNPVYFIPDPWTKTSSDKSYFSQLLTEAIVQ
jgi:hypothetical protein